MGDVYYCDDYEAITGKKRGEPVATEVIDTKVVEAAEKPAPKKATAKAETK